MSICKKIRKFCGELYLPQVSNYTAENVSKCYFPISNLKVRVRVRVLVKCCEL